MYVHICSLHRPWPGRTSSIHSVYSGSFQYLRHTKYFVLFCGPIFRFTATDQAFWVLGPALAVQEVCSALSAGGGGPAHLISGGVCGATPTCSAVVCCCNLQRCNVVPTRFLRDCSNKRHQSTAADGLERLKDLSWRVTLRCSALHS